MKLLALGVFFCASIGHAGLIKGNGGNSVVCPGSVELLDILEARSLQGFTFTDPNLSARALHRAKALFSEEDFKKLEKWIDDFETETQWLDDGKLGLVVDSFHFAIPNGCTVEQTVLAREPLPGEKRYLVQRSLFEALSPWQRDALKWHEAIYRAVLESRWLRSGVLSIDQIYNSESTRITVATLFADESEMFTEQDWRSLQVYLFEDH